MIYLEPSEYTGDVIPSESVISALTKASRHIDILTYNRIVAVGFDKLTAFQQEVVKEVCSELAEFEYENANLIDSVLQSYSINGVSMTFGNSWKVKIQNGVAMPRDLYARLLSTGLCYAGLSLR